MNKLKLTLIILLGNYCSNAQTVSADSAKYHIDELATVCGKVNTTGMHDRGTYLEMGTGNNVFNVVVYDKDAVNFNYKIGEYFLNKKICVTGKITTNKGHIQMVTDAENQFKIE